MQCALSMDEMKIKSGLVFNQHTGCLVGFVDLGGVNHNIQRSRAAKSPHWVISRPMSSLSWREQFLSHHCVPVTHHFAMFYARVHEREPIYTHVKVSFRIFVQGGQM